MHENPVPTDTLATRQLGHATFAGLVGFLLSAPLGLALYSYGDTVFAIVVLAIASLAFLIWGGTLFARFRSPDDEDADVGGVAFMIGYAVSSVLMIYPVLAFNESAAVTITEFLASADIWVILCCALTVLALAATTLVVFVTTDFWTTVSATLAAPIYIGLLLVALALVVAAIYAVAVVVMGVLALYALGCFMLFSLVVSIFQGSD